MKPLVDGPLSAAQWRALEEACEHPEGRVSPSSGWLVTKPTITQQSLWLLAARGFVTLELGEVVHQTFRSFRPIRFATITDAGRQRVAHELAWCGERARRNLI